MKANTGDSKQQSVLIIYLVHVVSLIAVYWKIAEGNIESVACLYASDGGPPSVSASPPSATAAAFAMLLLHHPLVLLLQCQLYSHLAEPKCMYRQQQLYYMELIRGWKSAHTTKSGTLFLKSFLE